MQHWARVGLLGWAACLVACGSDGGAEEPAADEPTTGVELPPQRPSMQVSGLMGTIPERKIQATLEPKLPSFARCFAHGAADVEQIAGRMELYFRVALDGHVEWVYPRASTVGHRKTEQCVLAIAEAVRFPGPKGGDAAELAWSFEMGESDVRPPVAWDEDKVSPALASQAEALRACGVDSGDAVLTLYVAPGGSVIGAGGAAGSREAAAQLDCLVSAVSAWTLPDPGSYPAKVSFDVP